MRILFVSSTTVGGSGRSQRELASYLWRRGHTVTFLVDDGRPATLSRWAYGHISDLSVRVAERPAGKPVVSARDRLGRRTKPLVIDGLAHRGAPLPQNALRGTMTEFKPDIVVVSSVERWAWRRIHATCSEGGVPTVLYVREDDSLGHLETGAVPDLLVANAGSLAERLRTRGFSCEFLPSLIDISVTRTESTRRAALAINPARSRGGDIVWQLAEGLPDTLFIVQESWPLKGAELADVEHRASRLPNVEFRRAAPAGPGLYGDARVLLVPYRVDNRPRVILEAQANGIPVIAASVPALVEAVGPGGAILPLDSMEAWTDSIRRCWTDDAYYESLVEAAFLHSRRTEVDPESIAERFESLLRRAVGPSGS